MSPCASTGQHDECSRPALRNDGAVQRKGNAFLESPPLVGLAFANPHHVQPQVYELEQLEATVKKRNEALRRESLRKSMIQVQQREKRQSMLAEQRKQEVQQAAAERSSIIKQQQQDQEQREASAMAASTAEGGKPRSLDARSNAVKVVDDVQQRRAADLADGGIGGLEK